MNKPHSSEIKLTVWQYVLGVLAFIVLPLIFSIGWPS